ncbi:hypothetical protein [Pseudarthrobacter enclensis]|uniref:hypothetical protein n=1 Tax=Pseudarthrobacter enclensis TaxID=993070 RepID=UPI003EDEA2AB
MTDRLAGPAPVESSSGTPAPAPAPPAGLLQPVVGQVSAAADSLVAAVPVVNHVVPAGTVSTVTAPVVQVADSTAATVVDTIVPPVAQAAPVLEPILEPVSDLVTGSVPLPVQLPDVPAGAGPEILPVVDVVAPAASSADQAEAEPTARVETPVVAETDAGHDSTAWVTAPSTGTVAAAAGLASTSFSVHAAAGAAENAAAETTNPSEPAPVPALTPAAPGSASGGSSQSSGAAGSAAWLSSDSFEHVLQGALLPWGFSAHTPSPVSFDPGSSPD